VGPESRESASGHRIASTVVRAAALVAALTVVARLVGFLRTAVLGRVLGATFLGDTYTATNALPNVVYEIVAGGALASLVIPVLAGVEPETARRTAGALLGWTMTLLTPLALLGVLFRRPLAELLLGGSPQAAAQVEVGARFLAVFAPQVVLYGVGIVCTGVLQSGRRFFAAALAPLMSSLVVIAAYLAFAGSGSGREITTVTRRGELILSVGTTLGVLALTATVAIPVLLGRAGWLPAPSLHSRCRWPSRSGWPPVSGVRWSFSPSGRRCSSCRGRYWRSRSRRARSPSSRPGSPRETSRATPRPHAAGWVSCFSAGWSAPAP
jgi:putative peptidoglycan lipid II flippase